MINKIFLVFALSVLSVQINFYYMSAFSAKSGALCLDGSPAAIYIYQPESTSKSPNKLLINFQSSPNGGCFKSDLSTSLEECHKWTSNDFGSSKDYASSLLPISGIMSPGAADFSNWPKVIIKSCDGGSYLGNRDPIDYRKEKIYFRGSKIVQQAIKYLEGKQWLKDRQEVVIVGSFNGGVAAIQWAPIFQQYVKNGKVRVIADSAYYLNVLDHKNNTLIQDRVKSLQKLALQNIVLPHQKCANAFPGQLWNCFFLENIVPLTDVPVFFAQPLYDSFHIQQVLGYQCAEVFKSLSECSAGERTLIEDYEKKVLQELRKAVDRKGNGAFGIACVLHEMVGGKYSNDLFEIPMNSGNVLEKAVSQWILGKQIVWVDEVDWPRNTPCAHKLALRIRDH